MPPVHVMIRALKPTSLVDKDTTAKGGLLLTMLSTMTEGRVRMARKPPAGFKYIPTVILIT